MLRNGQRKELSFRSMECSMGYLKRAHGSCHFSQGYTKVIAAVYGPHEIRNSKEKPTMASIEVIFKSKTTPHFPSNYFSVERSSSTLHLTPTHYQSQQQKERQIEKSILEIITPCICLEQYPRSGITIIVQEIQNDGNLQSTCINAVMLALCDASIAMKSFFCSTSIAYTPQLEYLLDPDLQEESQYDTICFTFCKSSSSCIHVSTTTTVTNHHTTELQQEALHSCKQIASHATSNLHSFMRLVVTKHIQKMTLASN